MQEVTQSVLMKHAREFRREIANRHAEITDDGLILFPKARLKVGGFFSCSLNGEAYEHGKNAVSLEGLDYFLNVGLHASAQIGTFYVGLFGGNVTPQQGWTGANFAQNATEFVNYSEATRQEFVESSSTNQSLSNAASPAQFTYSQSGTVYGAALLSNAAKASTTGLLLAIARFPSPKSGDSGDVLSTIYTIGGQST